MRTAISSRILLILLSLLALATSASADCAWVLWMAPSTVDPNALLKDMAHAFLPSRLTPVRAYTKAEACDDARKESTSDEFNNMLKRNKGRKERWDSYIYLCLPDTVDPREPKGK